MKTRLLSYLACAFVLGNGPSLVADQPATVTVAVNAVHHGSSESSITTPAPKGTSVHDGEFLETGALSRAELQLPSTSVTRLGANTVFNYSVESNTVDLQAGTILFCKPKEAERLNIKTAAVTAGIVGTTGFVSVQGEGRLRTYTLGIIEGHAIAHADDHPFLLGPGDALEFRPGAKPFIFAYDVPRLVKSSPLLTKFKGRLPNQSYIDKAVVDYQNNVSRGFIQTPSHAISYSGDIPIFSTAAYDSAQNAQGLPKGSPEPPSQPSQTYTGNGGPYTTGTH